MKEKILIVDDETEIADLVELYLQNEDFLVYKFYDAEEAWNFMEKEELDLALLDIMMPQISGLELCKRIRERYNYPIIMLTAKGAEIDKIQGLTLGADDYITKPFNILEVKARIKAILRRNSKASAKTEASSRIETGDMRMDCDSRSLFIHDKEVYLTAKEFDLLELLVLNPNKVYSRETLLNTIWGYDYPGDARTVDVHVRRLREKIEENPSEPKYVHTKWGVGYYFNV